MIGCYEKVGMGFIVGVGILYFFNWEGFVVDNVFNYEVVLVNGLVVNVN